MPRSPRLVSLAALALLGLSSTAACSTAGPATDRHPPLAVGAVDSAPSPSEADALDRAIEAHWARAEVEPTAIATDEAFLRRVTLDLLGRIPTEAERHAFVSSSAPDKRRALVDDLLARDAWAEHWAEILAGTLLGGAAQDRPREREGFSQWLERSLAEGRSWDRMTTDILSAQGELPMDGPAGFLATHGRKNRVEALTGQTARVFMGLQLQCAQCHDDPDDRFTQREFYGLAAFYARTKIRTKRTDDGRVVRVIDRPRGEMRLPTEHDAPGDRSGERVQPGFAAFPTATEEGATRREALVRGMLASDLFAKAAANHAWAQMMGRGIVEPWDDLGAPTGGPHPEILEVLADRFVADGYDLRALLRTIALSTAYQRSSAGSIEGTAERERAFAQAAVRPLPASALMRSLLVATGLDDVQGRAFRRQVERRRQQIRKEYEQAFDDDEMATAHRVQANVPQALLMLNGELTNQAVEAEHGALAELLVTHPTPAARITALHHRVYGRAPTPGAVETLLDTLEPSPEAERAYQDLMHAMLVSSEFATNH